MRKNKNMRPRRHQGRRPQEPSKYGLRPHDTSTIKVLSVERHTEKAVLLKTCYYTRLGGDVRTADIWFPKSCCRKTGDGEYKVCNYILIKYMDKVYSNIDKAFVKGKRRIFDMAAYERHRVREEEKRRELERYEDDNRQTFLAQYLSRLTAWLRQRYTVANLYELKVLSFELAKHDPKAGRACRRLCDAVCSHYGVSLPRVMCARKREEFVRTRGLDGAQALLSRVLTSYLGDWNHIHGLYSTDKSGMMHRYERKRSEVLPVENTIRRTARLVENALVTARGGSKELPFESSIALPSMMA